MIRIIVEESSSSSSSSSSCEFRDMGEGAYVGQLPWIWTPHEVDAHGVPENASPRFTSSSTHQLRSWLKAEA